MERWKLTFEYDGTYFSGWQKQPDTRTIEGEIEAAFSNLYQQEIDIIGQGRTDAGVHANGQVAHADLPGKFSSQRVLHAMRGLLPKDIALINAGIIYSDFHARFSAVNRAYSYSVMDRYSPLYRNRAWCSGYELNESMLHKMAELIKDTRDFVNFCIPDDHSESTTESTLEVSRWIRRGEIFRYEISGNRFLRHMVRRLVGSMVNVATGRQTIQEFQTLLDGEPVSQKGFSAPPQGLYLESVTYPTRKHKKDLQNG